MGEISVLGTKGDVKIIWDPSVKVEVDSAKKQFEELLKKGYLAFSVGKDHEASEEIKSFKPVLGKMILVPALVGG